MKCTYSDSVDGSAVHHVLLSPTTLGKQLPPKSMHAMSGKRAFEISRLSCQLEEGVHHLQRLVFSPPTPGCPQVNCSIFVTSFQCQTLGFRLSGVRFHAARFQIQVTFFLTSTCGGLDARCSICRRGCCGAPLLLPSPPSANIVLACASFHRRPCVGVVVLATLGAVWLPMPLWQWVPLVGDGWSHRVLHF